MACVKIISNPYSRELRLQIRNSGVWEELAPDLAASTAGGFFPFAAEDLVGRLIDACREGDAPLELVFEGTEDELRELQDVCAACFPGAVRLRRSDTILEAPGAVLPRMVEVFRLVRENLSASVRGVEGLDRRLEQFLDASNAVIPICVIGNYSSGKSSFINALIGREVLPNGDEPVTAKVYRLRPSDRDEQALLEFSYEGEKVSMFFEGADYRFVEGLTDKPLIQALNGALIGLENSTVTARVRSALAILNDFDRGAGEGEGPVSDLIELTVPFEGELWNRAGRSFVIFDTPGSNTASSEKHFRVLKEALAGFSNGIPVYVSEYTALDSVDNDRLYDAIRNIEELDARFTMIVVNKADSARLPRLEQTGGLHGELKGELLAQAVPRNLYAMGVFFVSSVMGLGAKTGGVFFDGHYAEIFEDQKTKYTNPESGFYRQLYRYDILPAPLRGELLSASEKGENLLVSNSGFTAVERAVEIFAGSYAACNKCGQSELFLRKVIDLVAGELNRSRASREAARENREAALRRDEAELLEQLRSSAESALDRLALDHAEVLKETVEAILESGDPGDLSRVGAALLQKQREARDYSLLEAEAKVARQAVLGDLAEHIKTLSRDRSLEALSLLGTAFSEGSQKARTAEEARRRSLREAERAASAELLENVTNELRETLRALREALERESLTYWETHTGEIRETLLSIVAGAGTLAEAQRKDLMTVLLTRQADQMEEAEEELRFRPSEYAYSPLTRLLGGRSEGLNGEKLRSAYRRRLRAGARRIYEEVRVRREESVRRWVEELLEALEARLVDLNPTLRNQSELIREETARIRELEEAQARLNTCAEELHSLLDWKEA